MARTRPETTYDQAPVDPAETEQHIEQQDLFDLFSQSGNGLGLYSLSSYCI